MDPGVEHAWELLADLEPADVCSRARVRHDLATDRYEVPCLGQVLSISVSKHTITACSEIGTQLLNRFQYFSEIAALRYLLDARAIEPSGDLVRPEQTEGGQIYFKGSHVLPLGGLTRAFGKKVDEFSARAKTLGGEFAEYADVSVILHPFPRVPIAVLLWASDDEFDARADLLLDSTCNQQLPPDALWSAAMMTLLALLPE